MTRELVRGDGKVSQVPGESSRCTPCSRTPVGPRARRSSASDVAFRLLSSVGSHEQSLSGLNGTACIVAVYASQAGSRLHHARLASGWVPTLAGRDSTRRTPVEDFSSCFVLLQASPGANKMGAARRASNHAASRVSTWPWIACLGDATTVEASEPRVPR